MSLISRMIGDKRTGEAELEKHGRAWLMMSRFELSNAKNAENMEAAKKDNQ